MLAILYCSEFGIYGRYGYGPSTRFGTWTIDVRSTRVVPATGDEGTVEYAEPGEATKAQIRDVFEAWRPTQVSEIRRRDMGWEFRLGLRPEPWGDGWKGFLVLHRDAEGRDRRVPALHGVEPRSTASCRAPRSRSRSSSGSTTPPRPRSGAS